MESSGSGISGGGSGLQNLTDSKLISFAIGTQKKSRFQKAREEKELKKKQDEIEAAKVYETFVASFEDEEEDAFTSKRFVPSSSSAGPSQASASVAGGVASNATAAASAVSSTSGSGSKKPLSEMEKFALELKQREERTANRSIGGPSGAPSRSKRQIDEFLEELKQTPASAPHHFEADEDTRYGIEKGSFDNGDPYTTNLYVGNLNPVTTEEELQEMFAHFGEIASVKIMWPRTDEERARRKNCGFVSFHRRKDADAARSELNEFVLHGYKMIVGWGKAVKGGGGSLPPPPPMIAPFAIAPLPTVVMSSYEAMPTDNGGIFINTATMQEVEMTTRDPQLQIKMPTDPKKRAIIDLVAKFVAADGEAIEKEILSRECENPDLDFLREDFTVESLYYRWRTYAFVMGDTELPWRDKAFQMTVGGTFVLPPRCEEVPKFEKAVERRRDRAESFGSDRSRSPSPHRRDRRHRSRSRSRSNSRHRRRRKRSRSSSRSKHSGLTGAQIERSRDKERTQRFTRLSKKDYEKWKTILQNLDLSRDSIKRAMGFAYDNIECGEEIVSMIKDKLILSSSFAAVQIAGLYLLSDLLHSSATPIKYATNIKIYIEAVIPEVVESIAHTFRHTLGRMSAFHIEERMKKLFATWLDWSIFPATYINGLESVFYMSVQDFQAMQHYVDAHLEDPVPETAAAELEHYKRKAKALGIAYREDMTLYELQYRIQWTDRYSAKKLNLTLPSNSILNFQAEEVNVTVETVSGQAETDSLAMGPTESFVAQQEEEEANQEDVDGQPLEAIFASKERMVGRIVEGPAIEEDEDDVDGVPIDDLDGIPMDEEDVDGVPMEEYTHFKEEEEDIDGEPLPDNRDDDEDIDGVPM